MKPQSAKAKGRRLQNQVRDMLIDEFDLHPDDVRSTSMGASGEDLLLSPKARDMFPFSVECKNQERISIWKALAQARAHADSEGHTPMLIFTRNRADTWAAIPLQDILDILVEHRELVDRVRELERLNG